MDWMNILFIVGAALMAWLAIRMIRGNPGAFSKENLSKSFYTIGWLALMIIAVIVLCIYMLKS